MKRAAALLALALCALPRTAAAAPPGKNKAACVAASESGQLLRLKGHLVEARAQFVMCAGGGCPRVVREDCEQWLGQLDSAIPSVIVSAELEGKDVSDVKVLVDGTPFVEKADGMAVNVDPGEHTFRFERAGEVRSLKVVVREGDKRRVVSVSFTSQKAAVAQPPGPKEPPTPVPNETPTPETTAGQGHPVLGFTLLGLGVVGLGASAYFGFSAAFGYDDLTKCRPSCAQSDVDTVARNRIFTAVAGGVGALGVGVGAYLLLAPTTPAAKVGLRVVPLGTGAALQGAF